MTVYAMLHAFSNEVAAEWRKTQRLNLALALTALFVRRSLTLSHLAQHFPLSEQPKVPRPKHSLWHRLKRLRRFLSNQKIVLEPMMQRLTHMALVVSEGLSSNVCKRIDDGNESFSTVSDSRAPYGSNP